MGGSATATGNTLTLTITPTDLIAIQADNNLCTWRGNCYIALSTGAISDPAENEIVALTDDQEKAALIVQTFVSDIVSPSLTNFTLNLNENTLQLTFSEAVNPTSFNANGVTIADSGNSSDAVFISISGSTTSSLPGTSVNISLTPTAVNLIKNSSIPTTEMVFIAIENTTIRDLAIMPNRVEQISRDDLFEGVLILDTSPPVLSGFSLDLDDDKLVLTFNEPINTASLTISNIRISSDSSSTSAFHALTTSTVTSSQISGVNTVTISLSMEDIVAIKTHSFVANDASSTFLNVAADTFTDTAGIQNAAVGSLAVNTFTADEMRATLISFRLNMITGVLDLTFNDVVDTGTFDPTGIILQSARNRAEGSFYRLTDASTTTSSSGFDIQVRLNSDLSGVKFVGDIGNSINTTYITIQADTVDDPYGRDTLAITDGKSLRASEVTPETTSPSLLSFGLDLNSGELSLTFNDVIDGDTFDPTEITVQNTRNITDGDSFTLNSSTSFTRQQTGFVILLQLDSVDLNGIKALLGLDPTANDTFISLTTLAASDSAGNFLNTVSSSDASGITTFVADTTKPEITAFQLDLNQATLVITFSETIDITSIDPTGITLQDMDHENSTGTVTLSAAVLITTENSEIIELGIIDTDFAIISSLSSLGTTVNNTYLSLKARSFGDTNRNKIAAVPASSAIQAAAVLNDTTAPQLARFDFDLDDGTLRLTFSEAIDIATVNATELTIQQFANSSEFGETLELSGGEAIFISPTVFALKLLNSDLNIIKSSGTFASNSSNTYISFTPDFVSDYGDNPVYGISSDDGARVVSYTNDTSPPTIASFVLDFNNSTVTIRFDEPINQSTPMLSDIVFQNSAESDSDEVSLSSSTLTVVDEFTIVIQVNNSDLNNLKLLPDFGLENSTFVNISSSDITDIYGNQFTDQVLGATTIVVDTLPPLLTAFSLDLGARELLLTFNEVVNSSTIDATKILLINSAVGPSEMVRLSAASVSESDNGQVVAIDLSSADLIALNMFMNLGTNITNTFIQLSSELCLTSLEMKIFLFSWQKWQTSYL